MAYRLQITEEDKQALRTHVKGARKSWKTFVLTDVFTSEAIHVDTPEDFFLLEAWNVNGEEGFTTAETRRKVLIDTLTEEPIDRSDTALRVIWLDEDAAEHAACLTDATAAQLQHRLTQSYEDA